MTLAISVVYWFYMSICS
uniref:Uncharacterized protein n=1 Tax=Rhizophora mucronata TaxID=61149 RepID=A0A2P2NGV1_RHIMU